MVSLPKNKHVLSKMSARVVEGREINEKGIPYSQNVNIHKEILIKQDGVEPHQR